MMALLCAPFNPLCRAEIVHIDRLPDVEWVLAGAMSDATLIARLGNEHTAGPALQQIAERQAMGMHASSSGQGQHHAANGWAGPDK